MFAARQIALASRRERLIAQAELQRMRIGAAFQRWEKPAAVVDQGIAAGRFLKSHPLLLAGVIAVAAGLGRRSLLRWAGRGFVAWRTWHSLGGWMHRLRI
jgi:hypothetical protein